MPDLDPDDEAGPVAAGPLTQLSDRLGVSAQTIIAGALAVLAAAGAAWWALRAPDPPPIESILPAAGSIGVDLPPAPTSTPQPLVVHVGGEVARPGVLTLEPGARVIDAISAAGGMTERADAASVNLAAPIGDGQRVWIPAVGESEPAIVVGEHGSGSAEGESAGPVDVNRAEAPVLETLPGIGPALAAAIIEHRTRAGPFRTVDGLLDVAGIGPSKLAQLRDLVVV